MAQMYENKKDYFDVNEDKQRLFWCKGGQTTIIASWEGLLSQLQIEQGVWFPPNKQITEQKRIA